MCGMTTPCVQCCPDVPAACSDWSAGGQASVNPKAETVEELKGRRKALHLGMCKLLREDLALKAEQRLADLQAGAHAASEIRDRVVKEFDELTRAHEGVDVDAFNADERYKGLMTEAIDGKAQALEKMGVFLESAARAMPRSELDAIFSAPLADFASKAAVLRLRTGITEFPWVEVVEERRADIDLGEWDAASASVQARELIASALGGNANLRSVTVKSVKLALSEGWATARLEWADNAAVKALPVTVAVVLRSCWGLTSLDLRCDGRG